GLHPVLPLIAMYSGALLWGVKGLILGPVLFSVVDAAVDPPQTHCGAGSDRTPGAGGGPRDRAGRPTSCRQLPGGGRPIASGRQDAASDRRDDVANHIKGILNGGFGLIQGMGLTLKHLFEPPITVQYPEERWQPAHGFRGIPVLTVD